MELRNDNFNLIKKGIGIKFTGKGINDFYNNNNIYNPNGVGIQLINNQNNNREIAFIDTSNINNNNFSKLKLAFNNSSINIRNLNENNQIQSLNFNNNLFINNNIGIGSTNPKTLLDVSGRISCYDINIGGIIINKDFLINTSSSVDNITSGILKIENGGTGVSSINNEQLLIGKFQQSPYLIWKDNKRRLGIGLTDPLYTLDVAGGINANTYKILGTDINNIFLKPNDLLLSSNECYNNCYNNSIISANKYTDNISYELINLFNSTTSEWIRNGNNIIYINSKVGIGTIRPLTSLHVVGDINYTGELYKNGVAFKNFSGNYNDLTNVPKITWELSNAHIYNLNNANVGIGTSNPRSKLDVNGDINFTGDIRNNGNKVNIFSGNYNDLYNIPSYSKVAYSGSFYDINETPDIFSGNYEDLINKPSYFPADWNSTIYNIPNYFPADWDLSVKNKPTYFKTDWITSIDNKPLYFPTDWNSSIINKPNYFPADWETTIINKPNIFLSDWNSNIINKPNFATVAFTGQYSNILNKPKIFSGLYRELKEKPNYAKVAFTGNYNDLYNRPNIFSGNFNQLKNIPTYFQTDWNSTLINIPEFSRVAYTGLYNDIIGIPNILWGESNSNIYNCNIGNVGIGLTNPTYKLDVRGSFNVDNTFQVSGLQAVLKLNAPWGLYFAEDWDLTTLPDSSGNGRHATTSSGNITKTTLSGNGAIGAITYISGGTSATISWPTGSIPTNFTILSLTRYSGNTKGRILQGQYRNWLHGHYNVGRGLCHYEGWKTNETSKGTLTDWLCCIGKNSSMTTNNILVDGIGVGTASGGGGNDELRINLGNSSTQKSDWALGCVMIWDRHLTDNEMFELNKFIDSNLKNGGSTKSLFLNQFNIYFNSDVYFSNQIFINNTNISNVFATSNDFIRTSNWVINGTNIYNVNSGSIGINTTEPSSLFKLDVNGAINSSGYNITGNGGLFWSSIGSTGIGCASFNGELSSSSLIGDMIIRSQEGNRLILQNGNNAGTLFVYNNKIGIGTNTPSSLLHLHNSSSSGEVKILFTDASTGFTGTDGFSIYKSGNDDGYIWNYENSAIRFATSNTERMCILADGKIGIGTNNPNSFLHLHNNISSTAEIKISMTDGSTGIGTSDGFAIYKSSSHDGYIWNYENFALRLGTNNTERITILNDGNIGIGTNNPSSLLHLHNSNLSGEVKILFTDTSTGIGTTDGFAIYKSSSENGYIWNYENYAIRFGTNNSEKMCITSEGNLGIGTTNPISILHLHKDTGEIKISMTDSSTGIGTTDGFAIYKSSSQDGYIWNYENFSLRFGTSNNERMCITSEGNLGIGTNNPSSILHLHNLNPSGELKILFTDASTGITANDGFSIFKSGNDEGNIWNYENSSIRFGTSNNERMCILADGKVGIGTNNPNSLLHLHNNIASGEIKISMTDISTGIGTSDGFVIYKSTSQDGYLWNYENNALRLGTNNTERMTILNNGNIGIGSTNPQYTLDVNGTINATFLRGDGSNISNLNFGNISTGVLSVSKGGIGTNTLTSNLILIGNGTSAITQNANLYWDNTNNRLGIKTTPLTYELEVNGTINATFLRGDGANITNLSASNISSGVFNINRGGIGTNTLTSNYILVGDGTISIKQYSNLYWDSENNRLGICSSSPAYTLDVRGDIRASNLFGDGANITNLNANYVTGVLPVSKGGIGTNTLTTNQILIGYGTNAITQNANLYWDNGNSRLGIHSSIPEYTLDVRGDIRASNLFGDGANISNLNINYISGVLPVSKGGIGTNTLTSNYILVSDGTDSIKQYSNFVWNTSTNRLGICSSSPAYTLDIVGDINFTGNITKNGSVYNPFPSRASDWVASTTNIYYISGNVGIGTNAPSIDYKLDVNGNIKCTQIDIGTKTSISDKTITLNNTNDTSLSKIIFNYNSSTILEYGSISYSNGLMTFYNRPVSETTNGFYFSGASFVGIGINPEKGIPLKVASGTTSLTGNYYYLTTSTSITSSNKTWTNVSAYFDSHILVNGDIVITSDNRIKNNINDINSKKSLDLISKINPKSFKYIDFVEKGDKNNYGFIAQDIKKIIPEAVGYKKENIPNIFKLFNVKDDIIETTEDLTSQLSINDNIKIINKDNKEDYKILKISSNQIKIDKKIEGDKCFIYGKEIDDFHILDKDIIFTLNVSATQELNKKIKKQNKNIKKQNNKIKEYDKIIKERRNKLKEQQEKIDLLFELLANK
jgi:hypothetical protein